MLEKIKSYVNKKYTTISLYVIVTVAIVFALIFSITKIGSIYHAVTGGLKFILKILTPVFIGLVIAYIMDPLVNYVEKLLIKSKILRFKNEKKYRTFAVLFCILGTIILIIVLISIFVFSITKEIASVRLDEIVNVITNYVNSFSDSLANIKNQLGSVNINSSTIDGYVNQASNSLINALKDFTNNLAGNTKNISSYVSNFVFGLIIAIYILLDKKEFARYLDILSKALFSEKNQNRIKGFLGDADKIFSGYIRGQLLDALFMSVALSICLTVIGIKFGVLIGVLAGLCNLIPYFGPIVAFAGTIFFGLLNGQYTQVGIAIVVLLILQQIDGNIIGPKLLGNSVSLKPIFILVAVLIGSQLAGVVGMVLAVPVTGILKQIFTRLLDERIKQKEAEEEISN